MRLNGELQITNHTLGQPIAGKLFRPFAYETVGAVELEMTASVIAIKLYPNAGDPDFKEPVVVLLRMENVEAFVRAIRIAQAGLHPDVRKGGSA
jgi:hypothetical protein